MQIRRNRLGEWGFFVGLVTILIGIDQVTKWLVRQNLAVGQAWAPIPALASVFTFTHVQNTGVAFGQLQGLGWLFMVVNIAVFIGVIAYYPQIPQGYWTLRVAASLILAGGVGNMIDRLWTAFAGPHSGGNLLNALSRASVTDFFDIKIWPVWNVADMCIVGGVMIMAWFLWREEFQEEDSEAVASEQ